MASRRTGRPKSQPANARCAIAPGSAAGEQSQGAQAGEHQYVNDGDPFFRYHEYASVVARYRSSHPLKVAGRETRARQRQEQKEHDDGSAGGCRATAGGKGAQRPPGHMAVSFDVEQAIPDGGSDQW